MVPALGLLLAHQVQGTGTVHQALGHEHHEDGAHPVKAEPLGRLVADDVRDAAGHPALGKGGGVVLAHVDRLGRAEREKEVAMGDRSTLQ